MRITFCALILAIIPWLGSCGGSPTVKIDIDLAVNQSSNPLTQIENDRKAAISQGLYFRFVPLVCPPNSIGVDNPNFPTVEIPPTTQAGSSATKNSYTIDNSQLLPRTYYRVEMFSLNFDGSSPFFGTGDCPVNVDQPSAGYQSTICFGPNSGSASQLCTQTKPFAQCGVDVAYCTP